MDKKDIRIRFTEEQAKEILNDIKNKICDVDLDDLFAGETAVDAKDDETKAVYKKIIQAIRVGLVEWDEEKNCLVQHLIRELKSGTMTRKDLYYKNRLKFGITKNFDSNNGSSIIKSMSEITVCPVQLIEELTGQDLTIAIGCMGFFDK